MSGKMKKFNIRGMFDGLRQSVGTSQKSEAEIEETLRSEDLQYSKVRMYEAYFFMKNVNI